MRGVIRIGSKQIAQHPLDPYGFEIFWFQWPEKANWVLCPVGVPYWLALGITLFGPMLWALKLWMTPIALGFTWSIDSLLKHGGVHHRGVIVWMLALSPTVLPGFNLMLDVPVMTLSMLSLATLLRAMQRESWMIAALAGVICGAAMQTKWTASLCPPLLLLLAWQYRQWLKGLLACFITGAVVLMWEMYIARRYGQSHLTFQITVGDGNQGGALRDVMLGFFPLIGASVGVLLPILILRAGKTALALAAIPAVLACWIISPLIANPATPFALLGVVVLALLIHTAMQMLRQSRGQAARPFVLVIVTWMLLEVAGYFLLSPVPAMRRLIGFSIASTLLTAIGLRDCVDSISRRIVIASSLVTILLGLGLNTVDYLDARAIRIAATKSVAWVHKQYPTATVYFAGHWEFQYYAELAGATPLVPDESRLHAGDVLLVNDVTNGPAILLPADKPDHTLRVEDGFPLSAIAFHQYRVPLLWRGQTRVNVGVFRMREDRRIYTNRLPEDLVPELEKRLRYLPDGAIDALIAAMQFGPPETQKRAAILIRQAGPRAFTKCMNHESPQVRLWAQQQHFTGN